MPAICAQASLSISSVAGRLAAISSMASSISSRKPPILRTPCRWVVAATSISGCMLSFESGEKGWKPFAAREK
jgi:hypothetical protein